MTDKPKLDDYDLNEEKYLFIKDFNSWLKRKTFLIRILLVSVICGIPLILNIILVLLFENKATDILTITTIVIIFLIPTLNKYYLNNQNSFIEKQKKKYFIKTQTNKNDYDIWYRDYIKYNLVLKVYEDKKLSEKNKVFEKHLYTHIEPVVEKETDDLIILDELTVSNNEHDIGQHDDINLDSVFAKNINQISSEEGRAGSLLKKSQNEHLETAKNKMTIGLLGELYVLEFEKKKLILVNKPVLATKIQHTSHEEGDGYGYDIKSYNENGEVIFIEVKTTSDGLNSPFYLTQNEYIAMKSLKNYYIYRVFDFDTQTGTGKLYIIDTQKDFEKFFSKEPITYKIKPNRLI